MAKIHNIKSNCNEILENIKRNKQRNGAAESFADITIKINKNS